VSFTYNGSANVPTNAGSYTVIGTITDVNYQGSATNTLVIAQASGSITLGSLSQTYTGSAKPATATTTPTGLAVSFTYNGSANAPTNAGSYTVIGTITDANYQGSATNTLVINAATLTYTANASSMTYGSAVPGLSGSVSGFVGTDNQGNATTGTLTFTPAATSTSGVGSYAINGTGLTANNGNYTFVQATGNATALTINALPVNLTGTRSYDGTAAVAAGILSVANKVGSDNVTVASGNGTLAGANVGSEAITSLGTLALGGTAAGNYTLASASGSVNITVSALALTVTNLLALDQVYDGTTNATLDATNAGLAGVLNGDSVTLVASNAVAYFADKNVGTNKPVTVTGLALGSTAAANYTLADPTNVTANITAAELTVAGVTAASKVYDGTTNAQLSGTATLSGEVSGDDVSLVTDGVSAAFAGLNVGTGIPVTVSGYAITGADAGNYTLTQPSGLAADITAATLTITATANTKTYDGTTSASATPTISGLQGSDTVSGLAETYDTKNVGTGKTLSVSAYTVNDGNSGNNYTVGTVTSTAGVIGKTTLTITAATNTKTYDGTTSASATPTISGLQGSDTVSGLAETYDTKNVGTGKTLSVSAYMVNDGNAGANYTVSTAVSTAGVISPATLTITAATNIKTYDGTTSAAATPTATGLQGSDSVSGLAETYDTKDAGTGKTLSVSAYTVNDGNAGANYTVSTTTSTAGVINAATLTITAAANTKTYDGTTSAAATPTISGLQGSDTVSGLAETYDTKDAGTGKTLSVSAYLVSDGNSGNNYTVSTVTSAAGVINAATLTYTANATSMTYGSAVPGLSGSVSGFVGTDNQGNATTGTLTFTPAATSSSGVGSYAINGAGLTANNGNYTFVQATGNATALTINALPVNLTGTRSYDGTAAVAAGILSVANKVGSDNVTVAAGSGTLAGANVGSEAITSLGTLALGGTAAGNYTLASASGSVNITVSALALTVTNLLALDNVYDGTTNATLDATNAGLAGVLNGDDVTLVTSNAVAYFADKNVGTNKPVTVTGLALDGAAAVNYTLVDPTNVTANITAAGLTVNGVAAASKVYDGTTNAQLNGTATLNGKVSGDDVSLVTDGVNAAFAGPNVGTGIPVTVSEYAITGADAGNYTLTQPSGLAADITAATLTITAAANTKIYDGTTSALATPTISGLQGSDTVSGLAETYDTKDAGTGKTLSVSAYTVNDGNSGNNYTVSTVTSTAGVIVQASGSVALGSLSQTYNGMAEAATATTTPSGLAVSFTYNGSATVPTSAGSYTVIGTITDANYQGSATNTLVIAQASGAITLGSLSQTYSGLAELATATTTPTGLAVSFTYNGSATAPTNAGSYTVLGTITDANYQGSATNTMVINKATLTVTADNKSKMCGQPNPPLTASYNGFVSGENANVLTSPVTLNTTAATSSSEGTYPITASGAVAANYTINYVSGILTVDPTPLLSGVDVNVNGINQFIISWPTVTGHTYQLEYKDDLMAAVWTPQGSSLPGNDAMAVVTNNISDSPQRFFRVQVQ
jgi:hypothetical protein